MMVKVFTSRIRVSFCQLCACAMVALGGFSFHVKAQGPGQDDIDPPQVLIDAGLFKAATPEHADRMSMTWEEVLASVEPEPWPDAEPIKPAGVLPHAALELIKESDVALKQGQAFRAVELLRRAEEMAPDHPKVSRALGLAYAESGNLTRAAEYLRRGVAEQSDDVEALLLLARHAAQRGSLERTLAYTQALRKDESAASLADYFCAIALMDQGYANAAASRFSRVIADLDQAANVDEGKGQADSPRLVLHELLVVREMLPTLRVMRGDLLLGSGEIERASEAYADIQLEDHTAQHALIARRVYLALRTGDQAAAVDLALSLLASPRATQNDARLVDYLLARGIPSQALAKRIEALLQADGVTLPMLVAFAQVAESDRLLTPIQNWISAGPTSPKRLRQVVALLQFDDREPLDAAALADLLVLVADIMQQSPAQASRYAHAVLDDLDAPVTLLRAIQSDRFDAKANDGRRFLSAVAYERADRLSDALLAYRGLLDAGGPLSEQTIVPAVRLHLALGQGDEAHAILGEPAVDADWQVFSLAMRAMAKAGKAQQAITQVDTRIKAYGKRLRLDVLRIELIAEMGQPQPACNLLLRLISSHPNDPSLYLLGINLAYNHRAEFNRMIDADRMRSAFLSRLLSNLPDAPLARISMAQNIKSNPSRVDEAEALLLQVLEEEPNHAGALLILTELYDEKGDSASAEAMYERYAMSLRPGLMRALLVADRAIENDQLQKAVEVLDGVLELDEEGVLPGPAMSGDDASSLLYRLSLADPERDTDAIYLSMVRRFPDHVGLNNALGYRWASQDKNLLQAKAMIDRALKADPRNHSILDSMAWVQYKLGLLDQAKATQTQALTFLEAFQAIRGGPGVQLPEGNELADLGATTAILNDHMGDILYKLGDSKQALEYWRVAQKQTYTEEEMLSDPELKTLAKRVEAKIDAMAAGEPVPVAEIPGPQAHGPDGHPSDLPVNEQGDEG